METTLIKIVGKTLLSLGKCTGLVILSAIAGGELRKNTQETTNGILQTIRFVKSGMDMKKTA